MHFPDWQRSFTVHFTPSSHTAPLGLLLQPDVSSGFGLGLGGGLGRLGDDGGLGDGAGLGFWGSGEGDGDGGLGAVDGEGFGEGEGAGAAPLACRIDVFTYVFGYKVSAEAGFAKHRDLDSSV
jgi:hypothetical protein